MLELGTVSCDLTSPDERGYYRPALFCSIHDPVCYSLYVHTSHAGQSRAVQYLSEFSYSFGSPCTPSGWSRCRLINMTRS